MKSLTQASLKDGVVVCLKMAVMLTAAFAIVFGAEHLRDRIKDQRGGFNDQNCVGSFNTIPCHQMKINQLLKERDLKGVQ